MRENAGLAVERLSFEEFARLEHEWEELNLAVPGSTPFTGHPWVCAWWRHFGSGQEFAGLVVRRNDMLVAGAPIGLRRLGGPGRTIVAEIVGTAPVPTRGQGLADRTGLLVRQDAPEACEPLAGALLALLDRADAIDLKGLDAGSPALSALLRSPPAVERARERERSRSPYLPLPSDWEVYLRSRSQKFRKNLRRCRRLLEADGPVAIEHVGAGGDPLPEKWFDEVVAVNEDSWTAARGTDLYRHPALRAFLRELFDVVALRGWLDLHVLRVARRAVAYELCFDYGGRVLAYNASYRRAYSRASPGTLVTASVIRSAIDRGRSEYDMLRGAEDYKLRWSDRFRTEAQIVVPAGRLRSRVYLAPHYLKQRLYDSRWLRELDDRFSGLWNRLRYR